MKGTVIRRGNKWSVIDLGRDPVTNKRRRDWHSGYGSEEEAEQARISILASMQKGAYVEPSKRTLGSYLTDEWLPARRGNVAATTFANYEHQLRSYVIPYLGGRPIQTVTPAELNAFYAGLIEDGARQAEGGLSPTSVRNVHAVLRKAFEDAVRWNLIARNPAKNADPPKPQRSEMKTWTADQIRLFLDAERDTRELPIWRLAVSTGMRRGEILGLPWKAVDLDAGKLSIVQTLVLVKSKPTLRTDAKTSSGRRPVELDRATVGVLREHRRRQAEERLRAGTAWDDTGLVFTRADGSLVKPDWLTRTFAARAEDAGLPKIRFHDLRHSWATIALANNVHPKVVQERLGHSSINVTLDTYSHIVPGMDRDAAERVAGLFS
jgi:integrase